MTRHDSDTITFEEARPRLLGLAYRILGSHAEAEDVVQDTFLAWSSADKAAIASPKKWLSTVCTRRAIDAARSARLSRTNYVGAWLPEPLQTNLHDNNSEDSEAQLALAESLTTAFLLAVQRLSAKERAAFILYDVFDTGYDEIAAILEVSEAACRKLVSRARVHVRQEHRPSIVPKTQQEKLTAAFLKAVHTGETLDLANLFSAQVVMRSDSGGKAAASDGDLVGAGAIFNFMAAVVIPAWRNAEIMEAELNAGLGFVVRQAGKTETAVTFGFDAEGRVEMIYVMRNPDKLTRIN